MPKPTKGPRLGGSPAHERIILANLASQLFEHGRITTTEAKAKRVRPLAEKLISKAKRGDLHARRLVLSTVGNRDVVHILFTEIAPTFADRDGGYTRITKVGPRKGDNAPMAIIELVTETVEESRAARAKGAGKTATKPAAKKATPKKAATKAEDTSEPTNEELAAADGDKGSEPSNVELAEVESKWGANAYVGEEPPPGYDIKGNADSMKYHTPESPWYDRTIAEVWFDSAEAAEAAGFEPVQAETADDEAK